MILTPGADPMLNNSQTVTLTDNCLPAGGGKLHLLFLNNRNGRVMVVQTAVKTFKWLDGKEQNVTNCK